MNNEIRDQVIQDLKESGGLGAEYIITDNAEERISAVWFEEGFAIKQCVFVPSVNSFTPKVIILNTREALDIASFILAVHSLVKGMRSGANEIHQ